MGKGREPDAAEDEGVKRIVVLEEIGACRGLEAPEVVLPTRVIPANCHYFFYDLR